MLYEVITQDTVCTITNTFDEGPNPPVSLTVFKNVNGGSALPDDFDLTVDGNPVLSGQTTFYSQGTTLSLGETQQPDYFFSSITGA